MGDVAVGLDSG